MNLGNYWLFINVREVKSIVNALYFDWNTGDDVEHVASSGVEPAGVSEGLYVDCAEVSMLGDLCAPDTTPATSQRVSAEYQIGHCSTLIWYCHDAVWISMRFVPMSRRKIKCLMPVFLVLIKLSIQWIKRLCWLGGRGLALDVKKGMIGLATALVLCSCRESAVHFLANGGVEALAGKSRALE